MFIMKQRTKCDCGECKWCESLIYVTKEQIEAIHNLLQDQDEDTVVALEVTKVAADGTQAVIAVEVNHKYDPTQLYDLPYNG